MAVHALFEFLFTTITAVIDLLSRAVFNSAAVLLVVAVQAVKLPSLAVQSLLDQLAEAIKNFTQFLFESIYDALSAILATAFDILVVVASQTFSGARLLVEKAAALLGYLVTEELPNVVGALLEMVAAVVGTLWNNFKEALAHVTENA